MEEERLSRSLRVLVGCKEPNSLICDVGAFVWLADSKLFPVKKETEGTKWDSLV